MAKELILEVVARKNSRQLNELADEFDKAARKAEGAGKSFSRTASFSRHLDTEIAKTKTTIRDLGQEFERTGNKDVFAKLRTSQRDLRGLENIRKQLTTALESGAKDAGPALTSALRTPIVAAVGGSLALALAQQAGVALGGAISTGIGLAGIGAGIAGQIHDPQVQRALERLRTDASNEFRTATASFRDPLIAGIGDIDREIAKLRPGLTKTFETIAPGVRDLSKGAAGFIDALVPGLERAAVASRPLIQDLGAWLPRFGSTLGSLFDTMAAHEGEALKGLHSIENVLQASVVVARDAIPVFTKLYQIGRYVNPAEMIIGSFVDIYRGYKELTTGGEKLGRTIAGSTGALGQFASVEQVAANNAHALSQAMSELFNAQLSADQATITWKGDLAGLKAQLDAHSRTLDTNTAAGRTNASALLAIAADAERAREAAIAQAGGTNASAAAIEAANAKYRANIKTLEALAAKLGVSSDAVHKLLDGYIELVNAPNILKTIKIVYTRSGEPSYAQTSGGRAAFAKGGFALPFAAAKGLIYRPSNPPLIKFAEPETGGEAYIPRRGIPAAQGLALANVAAGWFGGEVTYGGGRMRSGWGGGVPTVRVVVEDTSGQVLVDKIVRFAMDTNRTPASLFPASSR